MQIYGIDLSKDRLDVNYIDKNGKIKNKQLNNKMLPLSKFLTSIQSSDSVLCAEHTGTYGDLLVFLCNQIGIKVALIPGYNIKHSLGLIKGKSDPIDASRIREYGERFYDKLSFKEYDSEEMVELKSLYSLRSQLVKSRKLLLTGEHSRSNKPLQSICTKRITEKALANLDMEIEEVDSEIEKIISANDALYENYGLAKTVIGVGPVIAVDLIIKTGNFKVIDTSRKASSYAGVCPFPNSSGKMVGKNKTSPFADKKLKSLLYMGAKSAVKHNKEYALYYQKKKMEGKPHYLIMNNISNKMLRTIYSVIKNKKVYDQNYICHDPRKLKNNRSSKKVA